MWTLGLGTNPGVSAKTQNTPQTNTSAFYLRRSGPLIPAYFVTLPQHDRGLDASPVVHWSPDTYSYFDKLTLCTSIRRVHSLQQDPSQETSER
jgi:hypothetical protein